MNLFSQTSKLKLIVSLILIIAMFAAVFYIMYRIGLFLDEPVLAAEVTIYAQEQDKTGIDTETSFVLSASQPLNEKTIRDTLQVSPAFAYDLEKGNNNNEYVINPKEKLVADKIYVLSFDAKNHGEEISSWAFQTKGNFRVLSSLPRSKSTDVPIDTGIEVVFSHENYDFSKVEDYFTITPQVNGRFEQHKKMLVFIPEKLELGTIYTASVKAGFPSFDGKQALEEEYSFTFETSPLKEEQDKFTFDIDNRLSEFAVDEAPVLTAYFNLQYYLDKKWDKSTEVPSVAVSLYTYQNYTDFIDALALKDAIPEWTYQARTYQADLSGLTKSAEFEMEFISVDNYSHYIVFPEALAAGYYAAEIRVGECVRQVWLQVSDLATYLALGEEKGIIWVNDLKSKRPVKDVDVAIIGENITAKTDEDGVASIDFGFKTKEKDVINGYAKVSTNEKEAVVPLDLNTPYYATDDKTAMRDYWKYLYLERELFMPGDEMHFWGVVAPRVKGVDEIKEIQVELKSSSGYYYEGGENTPVLSKKIEVTNKTFEGKIDLPILSPDYYYLQVKYGDTILLSRGFSVETYQKPAYQLSLTAEKKAIFVGVGMNFQVEASFFEGTPVPGISLDYHIMDKDGSVTTDEKGRAKIPYIAKLRDSQDSPYYNQYLRVNTTLPEAGEIYGTHNMYVFRSSVYLQGEVSREEDEITVLADLSQVNLDKINQGEYPSEKNFMAGPASNVLVQGSIYQDVWEKVEAGERYDFINKKVVKDYYYKHSSQHVSDFSMITDENGQASFTGELEQENSYYIILAAEDNKGRKIERRVSVPGTGRPTEYDYKYYHFQEAEQGKKYVPGEPVSLTILENDEAIKPREKAFLYFRGQKQIETFEVSNSSEYGFTFNENNIPNVNVFGVYFDGVSYQETSGHTLAFASESKELKIQIKTDKTQYRPGETVALNVQVTDKNNKPVKAEVNLNLVDEAIYNMAEQQVNLLGTLYSDYIYMYLNVRKSHYHPSFGGGAEKGGEGDGERKDFRDTVLFTSVQTNNEGKAEIVFELPDNLTSWRVTYHAVTETLEAGSGTTQIPVKLPFFVELVANNSYLVGDAPVIVVRSYGEKLGSQEVVSYTMKLVTPDGQEIASTNQSSAFTAVDWSLPALQEGQYNMIVEGKSGDYQDKIIKDFTVVNSFLERTNTKQNLLEESFGLDNVTGIQEPITLVFSDYEKSQYIRGIYQLAWRQGSRLEQQLASKIARHLLSVYFPDQDLYNSDEDEGSLLRYQQQDGGISILPYAESDLYLTALTASSASAEFDSRAMAGYFYRLLEEEEEKDEIDEIDEIDESTVLWGLSALNEPVLLQINEMLESSELVPAQKIKLALAMLDIGNGAVGKKVFEELLTEYGEDLGATMRINVGSDQDEIIEATTQMALLASRLDNPNKNKLYQYLLENHGEDILNVAEQALILQYNLQYMSTEPVSFTYELKGEKVSKTLKNREYLKLTVLPSDVGSLKFSEISGKVGVVTAFKAPFSADDILTQEGLNVTRTYRVKKKETNTMERSDLVEVTISYGIGDKAPAGSYEIVDVLPAGLKYVSRPYNRYEKPVKGLAYPTEVKGQKLTFTAHKGGEKIVYYARVISPGEYIAEPVLLSHVRSNKISILGSEDRIIIK